MGKCPTNGSTSDVLQVKMSNETGGFYVSTITVNPITKLKLPHRYFFRFTFHEEWGPIQEESRFKAKFIEKYYFIKT